MDERSFAWRCATAQRAWGHARGDLVLMRTI